MIQAPSLRLLLTEPARAAVDFGMLGPALPLLLAAPDGDRHPVMVLPGMAADDRSTYPLRRFLRAKGYRVYSWKQGFNVGSLEIIAPLLERIADLRRRNNGRVSLVGWSLGGVYARELAKLAKDDVRFVVTLGSPFRGPYRASNVWRVLELLSGRSGGEHSGRYELPPPVPATAIYSRADGIVAWQCCIDHPGATTENVRIAGSHLGLGHNPLAMYVIADRLAQPELAWRPFQPSGILRAVYCARPDRP